MDEGGNDLFVLHPPNLLPTGTFPGIDESFCYLTTTGRRTGRPHEIEIWFGTEDGRTLYLLSGGRDRADWVRNLLADPQVSVRVGGRESPAVARVLGSGTDEDALARRLLVAKYAGPGDDLTGWGRDALAVALDLGPATPPGP